MKTNTPKLSTAEVNNIMNTHGWTNEFISQALPKSNGQPREIRTIDRYRHGGRGYENGAPGNFSRELLDLVAKQSVTKTKKVSKATPTVSKRNSSSKNRITLLPNGNVVGHPIDVATYTNNLKNR